MPNLVVDDLLEANRIGRMTKELSSVSLKIKHIPFQEMAVTVFNDAAWANASDGASGRLYSVRYTAQDPQGRARHHLHPVLEESQTQEEVCSPVRGGDAGDLGGHGHGGVYSHHATRDRGQRVRPDEAVHAGVQVSSDQRRRLQR
eukprot:6330940-Pyramimonas_sp.AAC.1